MVVIIARKLSFSEGVHVIFFTGKKLLSVVLILLCAGGAAGYFLFIKGSRGTFPVIAPGSYLGLLEGRINGQDNAALKMYVEKDSGSKTLFAVTSGEWEPLVTDNRLDQEGGSALGAAPVKLRRGGETLILTGKQTADRVYEGGLSNQAGESRGRWKISPMNELSPVKSGEQAEKIRAFLILKAELNDIDEKIGAAEISVAQQKSETARLTHYITEGQSLKRNADLKYNQAREELKTVTGQLEQKKQEAKSLGEKFEISQRVTAMGKLVYLARESLERENRWLDSMFKYHGSDLNADLDAATQRGERIIAIKNEIALEQDRVLRLGGSIPPSDGGAGEG